MMDSGGVTKELLFRHGKFFWRYNALVDSNFRQGWRYGEELYQVRFCGSVLYLYDFICFFSKLGAFGDLQECVFCGCVSNSILKRMMLC